MPHRDLPTAAKALMDSVNFDMAGIDGRGGNGGLISTETMRRSEERRQVLMRQEEHAPAADHDDVWRLGPDWEPKP